MSNPIFEFDAKEPEMAQAIQKAKATFKYFWRELYWENRRIVPALSGAMIKVAFSDGPRQDGNPDVEQMWVSGIDFDGKHLSGTLTNQPNWLTSVREGEQINASPSQLTDWLIVYNDKAYGAFTVNAIRSKMNDRDRHAHDNAWGLDFGDPSNTRFLLPTNSAPEETSRSTQGGGFLSKLFGAKSKSTSSEPLHEIPGKFTEHPMCINMHSNIKKQLEENKEMINQTDEAGWSMLHHEALAGNAAIVKLLVTNGANVQLKNKLGMTAADLARRIGWREIAKALDDIAAINLS